MKELIDPAKLPQHIAIIMDGNGRWAKKRGAMRVLGHQSAIKAVREATEGCAELGIRYLTLYAFSTENWNRPSYEVTALMKLLVSTIRGETKTLIENNVRLQAIGDIGSLPEDCQRELQETIDLTSHHTGLTLVLALSYSGRWDITQAMNRLIADVQAGRIKGPIDGAQVSRLLSTSGMPDPELLIRTSGELRISNFLLWQLAYTELHFTDVLWPDFRRIDLHKAILDFQQRERRFGLTGEQINSADSTAQ